MKESERMIIWNTMKKGNKKQFIEKMCGACLKLRWDEKKERYWCEAFTSFYFLWGDGDCPAIVVKEEDLARECFREDEKRELLKPGKGEKSDRTHKIFSKERMKDNRRRFWDGDLSF